MTRVKLRSEGGSALVTALMVMLVILPLGLALLAIVDTQAKDSGSERTRDRAFNLADSALTSAAFSFSRYSWPSSASTSPSNDNTPAAGDCGSTGFGTTLGATANTGSTTAKLQPNLNASYEDSAYTGATWLVNVCDDLYSALAWDETWMDPSIALHPAPQNWDVNGNGQVWVRAEANVSGRTRAIAALVKIGDTPALSSKYGVLAGRMNADATTTVGSLLSSGLVGSLLTATGLLADPLVAADPTSVASPATSGVIGVRCGVINGCLTGTIGATSDVSLVNTLVTGGKLVQSTSPTATSDAAIAQLKQQAINSLTYVATTAGGSTVGLTAGTAPPDCTIPAGANSNTIVYIEQVGTGDQYCKLDVSSTKAYKALVIGKGRILLRGSGSFTTTSATSVVNTFRGVVYALNQQRETLGDASTPTREVVRIDNGAHVFGGVAADGKSAQVGVYPPGFCTSNVVVILGEIGCTLTTLLSMVSLLNAYTPAIQSNVATMNAVKMYDRAAVVPGTFRDIAGERRL